METKICSEIKTMDVNQGKIDAIQEKMDDWQEEMKAQVGSPASRIDVSQEKMVMLDACLEKMEANLGELQSISVHQEVPKEESAVEMIVVLKDRHVAVGRRRQTKKRT
jgi:hypothetical protein